MVWGARNAGIEDLLQRLQANDPKLTSLTLLRQRKFDGLQDVERLCAALSSNTALTELNITSHAIDPPSAAALGRLLQRSTTLHSLSIGTSSFGDEGVAALAPGVIYLTSLNLEGKGIGPAGAAALSAALALPGCRLRHLNLGDNPKLGGKGLSALVAALTQQQQESHQQQQESQQHPQGHKQSHQGLQELLLHGSGIDASGVTALASSSVPASLVHLDLAHNTELGPDAAQHLAALLSSAPKLQTLKLQGTSIGDAGAATVVAAVAGQEGSGSLTALDLSNTGCGQLAGGALASALQSPSSSLRSVTLSGNPGITDSVVSQLAASLQGSTQKVIDPGSVSGLELDLSTTGVSSACLSALSEVSRLTKLSLLGCQLGDSGAGLLAQLMSSGSGFGRLQELVVSGCGVGEAGGQALLAAISEGHPPVLVSIELGGNPVCGEESFHEKVQACRELRPEVGIHWRGGAGDQQQ